jgi:hypothetical protein
MEVKMQTSFIPKKPITGTPIEGGGISLFLLISIILFIVAVAMAVGVFLWQKSLVAQIEKEKAELVAAKESYEQDTLIPLIRLDDRIVQSNILLSKHLAISPVFAVLESKILKNVRLKTMKFSYAGDGKMKIDLAGQAASYEALLKQSDSFGDESLRKYISTPVISDFSPSADGSVSFNFNAVVDPKLVSYADTLTATAN